MSAYSVRSTTARSSPPPAHRLTARLSPDTYADDAPDETNSDLWAGQLRTLRDAYAPSNRLEYTVEGLFAAASLCIIYGAPGSLKSLLLAYVAICVATDKPVIGRKVRQTGVLWIDLDNGRRRTDERFAALSRELNVPDDAPLYYVSLPDPFLDGANAQDIEHLAELVERLSIGLIVIDNLGLVSPSSDENSDAMIVVMSNFRRLCERTQAVMVLIHHQRKGNTSGRAGDALRGHSSIEGAVDLALHVSRHNESGNIITVASTKSRDTDVVPFSVAFYYEHKPDSEELLKAGFRPYEIEDLTSDRAIEGAILTIVHDQPNLTQKQVVSLVRSKLRAGVNRIRKIYNEMRASGQFKCTRA